MGVILNPFEFKTYKSLEAMTAAKSFRIFMKIEKMPAFIVGLV